MGKWLPFTRAGERTWVYMLGGLCAPVLTVIVIWALQVIRYWPGATPEQKLEKFFILAMLVATGLLIMVIAFACFISIRAIKVGKDGIEASGSGGE